MSNFRPQGNFGGPNQAQFNQQQQFSQNQMNNNPNMRQMQGNQQFPGNNMMQNQGQQMNRGGMSGSTGNDWDQFFQQTAVPGLSGNSNLQQGFNNNQMSNDNAANLLLRNNLLQQQMQGGNAGLIDQNLKNSLARTVGMVGGNGVMGGNMGMGNNMMGMNQQQQMPGRGNVGMGNMNMQQGGGGGGGGNMGGMNNMNRNTMGGGFNDEYNPFGNDNMPRGGGGSMGGSMGSGGGSGGGGGGGAGGGGNFQLGNLGQQRFDGFNNNQFNQQSGGSGGSALDVLSKLNNIVASTGGGLSARQMANARQNPAVGSRMGDTMNDGSNFNNLPQGGGGGGGGAGGFNSGPGLQMPQRRGVGGDMDVMPGDARFRDNNNQLTGMRNVSQGGGFNNNRDGNFSSNAPRSNFDVTPQQMQQQAPARKNNWDVDNYGNTNAGGGNIASRIGKAGFPGSGPSDMNQYSFSGNKRERDYSPSRSVSPPYNRDTKRSFSTRSPPRSDRGRSPPRSTSGPAGGNSINNRGPVGSNQVTSNTPFDYWSIPATRLIEDYNAPAVTKSQHTLTSTDLFTKFPNLYVPSDFMSIGIDWKSILDSMHNDKICQISDGIPFIFENTPAALAEGAASASETPVYTYLTANTVNNALVNNFTNYSRFHCSTVRPVKFNARVIVTCGIPNHQSERIDFNLPRKLRVLCGRRKGGVTLLGTSWSYELDGGDPLQDRSCLLNTARRAVYSQSLLDIFNPEREGGSAFDVTNNLTKLCEINYHRPREEVSGKQYPEQEEITAIYLYTMQPDSLPVTHKGLDLAWKVFNDRVKGVNVGPVLNKNVDDYHNELLKQQLQEVKTESAETAVEVSIDRTASAPTSEETPAGTAATAASGEDGKAMAVDGATASSAAAAASSDATAGATTGGVEVQKPETPTLFICPTPLPKDATDGKKAETVSLRVTPLGALLSYSVEDRNERAFETSIASEIVRSLIAVSNADIIVDFFLAEHPTLSHLADVRVVESIKVLREVIRLMRLEMSSGVKADSVNGTSNAAAASTTATATAAASPAKKDATAATAGDVKPESLTGAVDAESSGVSTDEASNSEGAASSAAAATSQEAASATAAPTSAQQDAYQVVVSEQEARLWRRRFVAACRWFDTNSDKYFTRDLTRLIINSSTKNMSRADVASLVERVCKGGRVNYEGFL